MYGIDLATSSEMVAHNRDLKAIAASINADEVISSSLEDLEAACAELSPRPPNQLFEVGVFCGRYVTPVSEGYFQALERKQGKLKAEKNQNGGLVTVGDSVATSPPVVERSDVSLHNMAADQ